MKKDDPICNDPSDVAIKDTIVNNTKEGGLPCAVAFKIAADLNISPEKIGACTDNLDIKLAKCQLGFFGYSPQKKIVKPHTPVEAELDAAIQTALKNGKLSCRDAWAIAEDLNIPKMRVSGACETLKVKIEKCQLGAFR